jgi:hypothetical protein
VVTALLLSVVTIAQTDDVDIVTVENIRIDYRLNPGWLKAKPEVMCLVGFP